MGQSSPPHDSIDPPRHSRTKQSLAVHYNFDVRQEILEALSGRRVPRQKDVKGRVNPAPPWSLDVHVILQLENGNCLKFWLKNHNGEIIVSGESADKP
jgi:hypothetical protein